MLDPGASAFLCGYGPFNRYVEHLRSIGFPLERLEFARPSTESLVEILESRGASSTVIEAAQGYRCVACVRYRKPNKPSPATLKQPKEFDVMWIKDGDGNLVNGRLGHEVPGGGGGFGRENRPPHPCDREMLGATLWNSEVPLD